MLKSCVICGGAFEVRGKAKTCSTTCSVKHRVKHKKLYGREYRIKNADAIREYFRGHYAKIRKPSVQRTCATCGSTFETRLNAVTCSKECWIERQRLRSRELYIKNGDAIREYDRKRRAQNREKIRKNRRQYNFKHPEKIYQSACRRRQQEIMACRILKRLGIRPPNNLTRDRKRRFCFRVLRKFPGVLPLLKRNLTELQIPPTSKE